MTLLKAKPTLYKDIRFRSRLEARWAVFLDALGGQWVYEPVVKSTGGIYQPDFAFGGMYLEIKPSSWLEVAKADLASGYEHRDMKRWSHFVKAEQATLAVCIGGPGEWVNGQLLANSGLSRVFIFEPERTRRGEWVECRNCGAIRIAPIGDPICTSCAPIGKQILNAVGVVRDFSYTDAR